MSRYTLEVLISARRDAWDAAHAALSVYMLAHRESRSWHPWGTCDRTDADRRADREFARLSAAEEATRASLASAMRVRGLRPLPSGIFSRLTDAMAGVAS